LCRQSGPKGKTRQHRLLANSIKVSCFAVI
jgi:hypothetical protein